MVRRKKALSTSTLQANLPEGWEIVNYREGSEYAIVRIRVDDLKKTSVRLVKLPADVREYLKQKQRRYRQKLKEKKGIHQKGG